MSANEHYKGTWANMKFAPYAFREYPKWIKDSKGEDVLVENKREEMAVVANVEALAPDDPVVKEKNRLLSLADDQAQELVKAEADKQALQAQLEESNSLLIEMGKRLKELEMQSKAQFDAQVKQQDAAPVPEAKPTAKSPPPPAPKVPPDEGSGLSKLLGK